MSNASSVCVIGGTIYFVLPTGKRPKDTSQEMQQAFDGLCQEQLEPSWITARDCQKVSARNPTEVYVCDPFEGAAFEHLVGLNCQVVGPLCVARCIQEQESLPRRPNPLYSLSFRHIVATNTGLGAETREEVARRVRLMGGQLIRNFTKSVTHVIAGDVGSKKYHVAANFKIPVMTPEWVDQFWEVEQYKLAHAASLAYSHMRLPTFKGLTICVSQVPFKERGTLKELIHSHGGCYSGDLSYKHVTHVALLEPRGDKYKYGRAWDLHCVHVRWIYESVEAGYALDESLYVVSPPGAQNSTPRMCEGHAAASFDCSVIPVATLPSTLNETTHSEVSFRVKDPLDVLDLNQLAECGQFLDGCSIYLAGFSDAQLERLRRVINQCGGMRFNMYSDGVTHVVVGPEKVDSLEEMIAEGGGSPHVVTVHWLTDSCTARKLLDVTAYLKPGYAVTTINADEATPMMQRMKPLGGSKETGSYKLDSTAMPDLNDIVEQYRREGGNGAAGVRSEDTLTAGNGEKLHPVVPDCHTDAHVSDGSGMKGDGTTRDQIEVDLDAAEALFRGLFFKISGFKDEDHAILEDMIKGNGGMLVQPESGKRIIKIVPLVREAADADAVCENVTIVTYCWLQMCVNEETLLGFDSDPLFQPFQISPSCKPLKDCVLSFSKFEGAQRECLVNLAESLGAKCQNFLVRKASRSRQLLPNTHLVAVEAEGMKYDAASKWGLPVVTRNWLIATAKRGKKADENEFTVGQVISLTEQRSGTLPDATLQNVSQKAVEGHGAKNLRLSVSSSNMEQTMCQVPGDVTSRYRSPCTVARATLPPMEPEVSITPKAANAVASPASSTVGPGAGIAQGHHTPVQGKRVSIDGMATPGSMLKSQRIRELMHQGLNSSHSSRTESSDDDFTPSRALAGDFVPKFKLDDAINMLNTPANCPGEQRVSLSDSGLLSMNLKAALDYCGNEDLIRGVEQVPSTTEGSISSPVGVLAGVTVSMAKKLVAKHGEMKATVESLGGTYCWAYNASCTHFIYEGKAGEVLPRDVRQARDEGKKLVSPKWVYVCRDMGKLVDEADYPFTYNARMSLSSHMTTTKVLKANSSNKKQGKSLLNQSVLQGEAGGTSHLSVAAARGSPVHQLDRCSKVDNTASDTTAKFLSAWTDSNSSSKAVSLLPGGSECENSDMKTPVDTFKEPAVPLTESQQVISNQVQELMAVVKVAGRHQSRRQTGSLFKPHSPSRSSEPRRRSAALPKLPLPDSEADFVGVTWDDPTRRLEMARLADKLAESESDSDATDDTVFEQPAPSAEPSPQKKKIFMFSGLPEQEKTRYATVASELGGLIVTSKNFENEVTHLVLGQALKNERFLASVAAGKYVLHKTFLDESSSVGRFVEEEEHEWGGPRTAAILASTATPSKSHKAAYCPRRWRIKIQEDRSSGAFSDWKAAIFASDAAKEAVYLRVLNAGGAQVVPRSSLSTATHALFDVGVAKKGELSALLEAGAKCVKAEYLAAFLTEDPTPPPDKYLIPEVNSFRRKIARSGDPRSSTLENCSFRSKRSSDMEGSTSRSKVRRDH